MTWRQIVVGVDFSEASLAAARWVATDFAPETDLMLVHVVAAPDVPSYVPSELAPWSVDDPAVPSAIYGGLRGLADLIRASRIRVRVMVGHPADALVRVAAEVGADLVCVGRGRRRRGSARFGATTSQRLLARSHVPTLIVPPTRLGAPSLVLAAVDDRTGGRRVLEVARRISDAHEAHVDAVHVIESELLEYVAAQEPFQAEPNAQPYGAWASPAGAGAWLRARAQDWVVAEMHDMAVGGHGASAVVQSGDAGAQVIRHARHTKADLIVIGRGGRVGQGTAYASLPVGSTARMVAWAAPCPVVVSPLEPALLQRSTFRGRQSSSRRNSSSSGTVVSGGNLAS